MRRLCIGIGLAAAGAAAALSAQAVRSTRGVLLADLSWVEAEPLLTPSTVVVVPLGAAAVEHGPHLKLNNNERLARYLTSRVETSASVVIAPMLPYHFYPAFLEYPGSTSLTQGTARDLTVDVVRSLARSGPRRFYVLNTGGPTMAPLASAAEKLADEGILLGYTDMPYRLAGAAIDRLQRSVAQTHADEIDTSMMLYVDPSAVDMRKARREYGRGSGPMTRRAGAPGYYSESGVSGDPTLATREKGRVLVETLVTGILEDIERLRVAALPPVRSPSSSIAGATGGARGSGGGAAAERDCTPQDERTIRQLGPRFSTAWNEMDAERIALMFTEEGDMRHPDGTIERGREVIRDDRRELFTRREYRGSVHSLTLNDIRCVGPDVAVADGKWELRNPGSDRIDSARRPFTGLCTLVVHRASGQWQIEAWRYTIDPPPNTAPAPTILKRPGWPGGPGH
jgi:creatinine amidohydrolase